MFVRSLETSRVFGALGGAFRGLGASGLYGLRSLRFAVSGFQMTLDPKTLVQFWVQGLGCLDPS